MPEEPLQTSRTAPLRVLLVDDEMLARARLRSLLSQCQAPPAQVVGEADDAGSALSWLQRAGPAAVDLLLLDVQMPGTDGLALAERLRGETAPPAVVFVTAHAEHALRAFEIDAVDYLTKPVRLERLQAALGRVAERRAAAQAMAGQGGGAAPALPPPEVDDVLVVNDRGRVVRVPIEEVVYLKAELKYVTLRTTQRSWLLDESLAELEPRLQGRFVRVHRNALVARKAIRVLQRRSLPTEAASTASEAVTDGWAVQLEGVDEWLSVSRRQLPTVREAIQGA